MKYLKFILIILIIWSAGCQDKNNQSIVQPIDIMPFVVNTKIPDSILFGKIAIHSKLTMKSLPTEEGLLFTPIRIRLIDLQEATDLPNNADTAANKIIDNIYFLICL